jgi:hypothetical protein
MSIGSQISCLVLPNGPIIQHMIIRFYDDGEAEVIMPVMKLGPHGLAA